MTSLSTIRIILVEPAGPLNVGSVARVMKNMGLCHLVLVRPHCDHLGTEARQMAVHAGELLEQAKVVNSLPEGLVGCRHAIATTGKPRTLATSLEHPREALPWLLDETLEPNTAALIFGPEDRGLNNEELNQAHRFIYIPSNPEYPSLNLAQAVAICGYELFQESGRQKAGEKKQGSREQGAGGKRRKTEDRSQGSEEKRQGSREQGAGGERQKTEDRKQESEEKMQGSREQEAGGKRQETEDRRQELEAIQNRSTEAHERPKSKIQNLVFPPSSPSPPSSLSFPPSPPSLPHSLTPSLPPPPAPLEQLEGFYQHLEAALLDIGYLYPHTAESRMQKFRRLYNRAMPTSDEVAMLRGILSQMDWAVKQRRLPK